MAGVVGAGMGPGLAAALSGGDGPHALPTPSAAGSGMYSLSAAPDGTVYLSWLEPQPEKVQALKFSVLQRGAWSAAREVARSDNWFVNWADHPTVVPLADGRLAAHWLANNGRREGSYGYGFRIAVSRNQGATWKEVYAGGTDNKTGYSGFVSLLSQPDGFTAIYLGPPAKKTLESEADHTMTLSTIRFALDGAVKGESVADAATCSCCSTSIVQTARGPLAAYRDRAAGEIRDIAVVRHDGFRWSAPKTVHQDGWRINACPTNGPALAAAGHRVAISWFTAAGDTPRVKAAFSPDAGDSFSTPVVIDGGRPVGWPAMVIMEDGSAVVAWLESRGEGKGAIRLRRVWPDGTLGLPVTVASTSSGRSTGIPQMVRTGDSLVVAWRNDRVQTAMLPIPAN